MKEKYPMVVNKPILVMGIIFIAVGVIIALSGYMNYGNLMEEYSRCLGDCFMTCSWCSLSQLAILREQINFAKNLAYVAFGAGAVVVILGIIACKRAINRHSQPPLNKEVAEPDTPATLDFPDP